MLVKELIERIASSYSLDDVLYILGKDEEWLLWHIREDLLEHKEDFMHGDDFYMEMYDE